MIFSGLKISGRLLLSFFRDGQLTRRVVHNNLVVAGGETYIAAKVSGAQIPWMSHIAIGTGNTAPVSADTGLITEIARDVIAGSIRQGVGPESNTITIEGAFPRGAGTGMLTEAGLFYGGTMFSRAVFPAEEKLAEEALHINWAITFNGV